MLNIGTGEIIFIAVAALLILGPTKLPEFARTIGKLVRDFRRQTDDVRSVVEREFYKMDQQLTQEPEVAALVPQAAPDAIAHPDDLHGDPHHGGPHHDADSGAQTELALETPQALPAGEPDVSQVMKGAAAGEPIAVSSPEAAPADKATG